MARKSTPSKDKSHNGLSGDEFQKQLFNWFQDRGLLSDLQAHLRHQMIVALRDTSLSIHSTGVFHQAGSPKLQAINLLVAEFLLRQQCHYTLSIFTSEVPLLRNLPEFSTAVSNSTSGVEYLSHEDSFPGFHERDVFDILEALGFTSDSEESKTINDLYEHSQGESLLMCIIRSLPKTRKHEMKTYEKKVSRSPSPVPDNTEEQHAALLQCTLFTDDVRAIIQQSNLNAEQIALIHNDLKRIIQEEVDKTQKTEEAKFHQELIDREQRIQAVWNRHDLELQEIQRTSEERINDEREKLRAEMNKKEAQFLVLAAQLKEQQHDVASRLNYIEERSDLLEQKEVELKVLKKESEEYLRRKEVELNTREKCIEEQLARLEAETEATDQEKKELQASRVQIEAASKALKESQSEIALQIELQKEQTLQLKAAQENSPSSLKTEMIKRKSEASLRKRKAEVSSQGIQVDISKQKGAIPKKYNAHQQTNKILHENRSLQTHISAIDLEEVFLQLHHQNSENERQRSQHEIFGNLVDQLQQQNVELQGHIDQQRHRIQELTEQASEYMQQLSIAHNTITRLRSQSAANANLNHHGVQTSPRATVDSSAPPYVAAGGPTSTAPPVIPVMDSVPGLALGAYGYHSPPPAPPQPRPIPDIRPPTRGFVRSNQVGAGEESYFSRRLPPESFVPLYTSPNHREQRRKPPRRLMVHSVSSSDESCPSPTEEMLREARRRLRRLEEETAAIDRSYQEFRLRQTDSLTNTASILFQPISLTRDYGANFTVPMPQNIPARNVAPNPTAIPFPATGRNRSSIPRIGLLNQFQSTTMLQPGILQPIPLFPFPRPSEQVRHSSSFTTNQAQNSPAITSLYTVPTDMFSTRPKSSQGDAGTSSVLQGPPLSTIRAQNEVQSTNASGNTRGDLRLPAGFSLREQSRYTGERGLVQSGNVQLNVNSPRWLQEPPPCISSLPQLPVTSVTNDKKEESTNSHPSDDKALVFLHQDNQLVGKQCNRNKISGHSLKTHTSNSPTCEPSRDISLESASDENIGQRLLSPPLQTPVSSEADAKSQLHNTKSCTELDSPDNLHLKCNPVRSSESSSNSPIMSVHTINKSSTEVPPNTDNDSLQNKELLSNRNLQDKDVLQMECSATCSKEGLDEKPGVQDIDSEIVDASEIEVSNSEENRQSQNVSKKSESISKVSQCLEGRQETDINAVNITNTPKEKESQESHIATNGASSEWLQNDNNESIPENSKELVEEPEEQSNIQHQSHSPSLPSSLGSSNDLSSNIISAGEQRSDDSW